MVRGWEDIWKANSMRVYIPVFGTFIQGHALIWGKKVFEIDRTRRDYVDY